MRHKGHVAQAVVTASERREELLGNNLLEEMRRVQRKAWELLDKTESEGDHRGSIVALREVRECLESLGSLLSRADGEGLAAATNDAILAEAKRRGLGGLEMRIRFVSSKGEIVDHLPFPSEDGAS